MSIAVARRGLGDLEGAREYYGKVMNLDPDNSIVQFNLGVLEHEHMAQNAQMGVNADDPPDDPIGQMDWNIANMRGSIIHYERALEHYRQYLYLDKSGEPGNRNIANERIGQVSQIIQMTNEQIPMMEQQKGDIRLAMEEEARWQAEQGSQPDNDDDN
jgi:tetratricopeptide (TPR) repeat protein